MRFETYVNDLMSRALQVDYLLDRIQYGLLRDTVEECFRAKGYPLAPEKKATIILAALFKQLVRGFDFKSFIKNLSKDERSRFLSALLYHIYYINLTLEHLVSCEKLTFYLVRVAAAFASAKTISKLLSCLSPPETLRLISFCLSHYDEGSYRIFRFCQAHGDLPLKELLLSIERRLVDKEEVAAWIDAQAEISPNTIDTLLQEIDNDIQKRLEKVAGQLNTTKKRAERCFSLFGLYNHQVPKDAWYLHDFDSLDEKLENLHADNPACQEFVEAINQHIEALDKTPEDYVKGFERITYALPTAGKDLSHFAWLQSMSEAINYFCSYFNIDHPPVFVFDQSPKSLFAKNGRYMRSLNPNLVHLDTASMLKLAKKLGIDGLLVTGMEGEFGYGGARNAIFFLAPLLKFYYSQKRPKGKSFLAYVLTIDKKRLMQDFKDVVLQEKAGPCVIEMGDDDVHIPVSTIFSDALFAYRHASEFFCRYGWVIGRRTTWTETTFNLEYVLKRSPEILLQHQFQESPFSHGMAGLLTKPKLCMNLPFGQEEAYLQTMKEYFFDFRLPSLHLSGYRFPNVAIPESRFAGLAGLLKAHYKYSVGMMLVADLLDPTNTLKKCALPWNDAKMKGVFKNLSQAISYMLRAATTKAMQSRFWKNVKELNKAHKTYKPVPGSLPEMATLHMGILCSQDVKKVLLPLKAQFPREVKEFEKLFTLLAKDAKTFKKLLGQTRVGKIEKDLVFSRSLALLYKAAGNADFQKQLQSTSEI